MHLNKILVLGCSRSGTTEFCKTLQDISSKKFVWEPEFNYKDKLLDTLGIEKFLDKIYEDKNTFGIKFGVYPEKKTHKDIIEYHDIVFFLSRRNVFQQALSLNLAKRTEKWRAVDFGVDTLTEKEKDEYNKIKVNKIDIEEIKKDITGIKHITEKTLGYLKEHKNSRILFYEDLFGFFSGVKLNTEDNYKNIENWQELKTFYEQNKDFCHFDL
tara:strand:+ start:748 stop:1386 length:639 start_codon:yes stop_codon:yes gene_type:complete